MAKIILDFYRWAEQRVRGKCMCKIIKGYHCYPSLQDKQCRQCWEEDTQ